MSTCELSIKIHLLSNLYDIFYLYGPCIEYLSVVVPVRLKGINWLSFFLICDYYNVAWKDVHLLIECMTIKNTGVPCRKPFSTSVSDLNLFTVLVFAKKGSWMDDDGFYSFK